MTPLHYEFLRLVEDEQRRRVKRPTDTDTRSIRPKRRKRLD
jgi:hypothetical protein